MPLPDLNDASCHRWLGGQSIQDPIVGEVAVPAHFALFRREAVPGEGLRQRGKEFLSPAIDGAFVSSAMHPGIAPLTPGSRLAIEIIQVGKRDAWPEVILDHSDRALDFALRLGRSRLTDPWCHPDGGHEIGKTGVPVRNLVHHLQEHTFHAVRERRLGQATEVLKGLHQTADHGGGVTAFDNRCKAHTRVAEDGGKPIELVRSPFLLVDKLAPVKLDLLSRLGLVADHGSMPLVLWAQGMDKGFEHAQAPSVAHRLQTRQHGLAIVAVVLLTLPRIGRVSKAEIYSIKSGKGSLWQRFKKSIHESSKRKRYGWPRPVGSRSRKLPASWALATPLSINGARNWQSMAKKRFQAVDTKR